MIGFRTAGIELVLQEVERERASEGYLRINVDTLSTSCTVRPHQFASFAKRIEEASCAHANAQPCADLVMSLEGALGERIELRVAPRPPTTLTVSWSFTQSQTGSVSRAIDCSALTEFLERVNAAVTAPWL